MKKTIKYLVFSLFMLFGFSLNVNAESLPAAVDGKITLDKDYTIDSIMFNSTSEIEVIDLNDKTLTVNGSLVLAKEIKVENGKIIRSSSHVDGPMVVIATSGGNTVNLKNVIVDSNNINVSAQTEYGIAYGVIIRNGSNAILDNVKIKNNYTTNENVAVGGLFAQTVDSVIMKDCEISGTNSQSPATPSGASLYVNGANNFEMINTKIYNNISIKEGTININAVKKFTFDKNSIIEGNKSVVAGGIRVANSNATIAGTIRDNKSTADNGAGIYTIFEDNMYSSYVVRITETAKIISNESSCAGGGLYVNSSKTNIPGKVIIEGATFSSNKALGTVDASAGLYKDIGGGAIAVARGILEINDIKMSGNTAAINKGNSIIVSHANGNANGGKLTINGGQFDNTIDLGVGSIVVNGGTFKQDMSKYITSNKLISKKTTDGYEVVENTVLENDNVSFENDEAMDKNYELVITEKETDKELVSDINSVVKKEVKGAKDIKVLAMFDISVSDGANPVEMKDGKYKITINLDEKLLKYNSYAGVYVDDEGKVTYVPVEVKDGKAVITTSHLSTYGVVGYNIPNPATNSNVEVIISIVLFALMFAGIGLSMKKQEVNA